jgi:hypothetical protein
MEDLKQSRPPRGKRGLPATTTTRRVRFNLCPRHLDKLDQLRQQPAGKPRSRSAILRKILDAYLIQEAKEVCDGK